MDEMEGLDDLLQRPELFVRQRKEWAEILVEWESRNQYAILDVQQNELGTIAERSGGLLNTLKRLLLRRHRPLAASVCGRDGRELLTLQRPCFLFFSRMNVRTPDGRTLGRVVRRFGILYKRYDLTDPQGRVFASIASPRWRLWTFPVQPRGGGPGATISKKWGGGLKEIFSDADTFRIEFGGGDWSDAQRAVLMAAAISIDFDFFEDNSSSGIGVMDALGG